jgi:glutamate racemase
MKCEKEVLITKACSKLVAHIEEGRMIKQHAKTVSEEFRGELKNREPDKE